MVEYRETLVPSDFSVVGRFVQDVSEGKKFDLLLLALRPGSMNAGRLHRLAPYRYARAPENCLPSMTLMWFGTSAVPS